MARIRSLSRAQSNATVHPTEVDCTYQTVVAKDGTKYLQLTTYGSDQRKSKPKPSQTIQMDLVTAEKLLKIIESTFSTR